MDSIQYFNKSRWRIGRMPQVWRSYIITFAAGLLILLLPYTAALGVETQNGAPAHAEKLDAVANQTVLVVPSDLKQEVATQLGGIGESIKQLSDKSDWGTPVATLIAAILSFVAVSIAAWYSYEAVLKAAKDSSKATLQAAEDSAKASLEAASKNSYQQRKLFADQEKYKRVTKQLDEFYGPLHALDSAGRRLWEQFCKLNHRSSSMGIMGQGRTTCFLTHDDDNKQLVVKKNYPNPGQYYDQTIQKPICIDEQRKFLQTYMRVMQHVFKPLNDQREQLVLTKSALIETRDADSRVSGQENQIPPELIELVAHVAEMRSLLKRWEDVNLKDDNLVRGTLECPEDQEIFNPSFSYPDCLAKYASTKFADLKKCQQELHDKLVGLH